MKSEYQAPEILLQFLFGHRSVSDVETFVYQHDDLGSIVGYVWENDFLSFNYRSDDAETKLIRLIQDFLRDISPAKETEETLWRAEVVKVASETLQEKIKPWIGAKWLWNEWKMRNREPWEDKDFAIYGAFSNAVDDYFEEYKGSVNIEDAFTREMKVLYIDDIMKASENVLTRFDPYLASG